MTTTLNACGMPKRLGSTTAKTLTATGRQMKCVSADMMKVVVLPIIPFKEAIFTSRLVSYDETFSVLMPSNKPSRCARKSLHKNSSACVLWHEALAGRSAEEVAASYVLFLETNCRDFSTVIIWADNCASQNKCWALLSTLLKVDGSALKEDVD